MKNQDGWSEEEYGFFGQTLREQIRLLLGDGFETELSQIRKNNGVIKDVLYVRKENNECVPCFYMDEMFRSHLSGESVEALADYVRNIVLGESPAVKEQVEKYTGKEWIEQNLFFRLINFDKNEEDLEQAVYVRFKDLAAVFYVLTESSEDGVKSFRLPQKIWESLELGEAEAYFPVIAENTQKLFPERLEYIEYMVLESVERRLRLELPFREIISKPEQELRSNQLYVLTNHQKINGAASILYPGMLEHLAKRFRGGFYIIPSSVHEVLLLKEEETEDVRLNGMVREVNETQVDPEEVLADHVYYYVPEKHQLIVCGQERK